MSIINQFVCNKCDVPEISSTDNFFMTHCGHFYCYKCDSEGLSPCPRCQAPEVRSIELTDPLPPLVAELLKRSSEILQDIIDSANFQSNQKKALYNLGPILQRQYDGVKLGYWENRKEIMKLQHLKVRIRKAIDNYKAEVEKRRRQQARLAVPRTNYVRNDYFFSPNNPVSKNFVQPKQNQYTQYNYGRKVAFVSPRDHREADSSRMVYTPSNNGSTPQSRMMPIETPDTIRRMVMSRRVHVSAGHSSYSPSAAPSSLNFSNFNLY